MIDLEGFKIYDVDDPTELMAIVMEQREAKNLMIDALLIY